MPNYLVLTDKETGKAYAGRDLIQVDELLCKAMNVRVDDKMFFRNWVDWACLYLKNNWAEVRKMEKETGFHEEYYLKRKQVLDWLEQHYSLDGYYSPR